VGLRHSVSRAARRPSQLAGEFVLAGFASAALDHSDPFWTNFASSSWVSVIIYPLIKSRRPRESAREGDSFLPLPHSLWFDPSSFPPQAALHYDFDGGMFDADVRCSSDETTGKGNYQYPLTRHK